MLPIYESWRRLVRRLAPYFTAYIATWPQWPPCGRQLSGQHVFRGETGGQACMQEAVTFK